MLAPVPHEVGGYILAGGKSSRMGRDKALLELGGTPLIRHAVKKLRRVCMDVRILSDNLWLESYAPLLKDIHPGCGPMSGMEAALRHSIFEWNLFLAVDMPFVPTAFILRSLDSWLHQRELPGFNGSFVHMYKADGMAQPGFCMVHKDVALFLTEALDKGHYKLIEVLQAAGRELAGRKGFKEGRGFRCVPLTRFRSMPGPKKMKEDWCYTTESQQKAWNLWLSNLNTPEDFTDAERHVNALDT